MLSRIWGKINRIDRFEGGKLSVEVIFMRNLVFGEGVPAGFQALMSTNREAMDAFLNRTEAERRALIEGAKTIRSEDEMRNYVNSIAGYEVPHPPVQL